MVTHSIQEAIYLGHNVAVMTSVPASILETVDTSDVDDVGSPAFGEFSRHLRSLLVAPQPSGELVAT
jgi:NitT/TauT family transport system ATP-binding protein